MEKMKKRGRGRPKTSSDDDAEFFKVFIPCRNSQQLKIPMSFMWKFAGFTDKKTKLKGYDGKQWVVDIEIANDGVWMKNGWSSFVNHYSLTEGEFLVFKYIGKFTFKVKVFGTDGCKTEAMPAPSIAREVEILDNVQFITVSSDDSNELAGSNKAARRVTEDPYFIKPVNYKQQRNLIIPQEMFSVYKVRVRPEMLLLNKEGHRWPVKVHECADGRILFGSGWSQFWKENNVQPSDTCKFTFLKGGSSKAIMVEILRGQA